MHVQVESILLAWAVLCEKYMMSQEQQEELDAEGERYLRQRVCYEGGNLLDANGDAVMMPWEKPLMLAHANLICQSGGDVLNVGFGLGLVDEAIQECGDLVLLVPLFLLPVVPFLQ
jgi:type IV protein arginine methyltransferase